ncbi:unnamed protein product [Candida verbasci]|uniref:DUF3533 domain-containing protein n=1 Tax=Candida verbasci TaxID=1227364 RepID=A0A9W4XNH0_9ASCO|nr:unnamed protein product [Candida verbasci]
MSESVDPLDYDPANGVGGGGITTDAIEKVQSRRHEEDEKELPYEESLTWPQRFKEYILVAPKFAKAYITVFVIFMGLLSLYWGSMYRRFDRYKNMDYLVISQDESFQFEGQLINPSVNDAFMEMLNNEPISNLGKYHVRNITEFKELAIKHNNTVLEEVIRQVHHQKYWAGVYIAPNTTYNLYSSFHQGIPFVKVNESVSLIYETGRHYSGLSQYIFRNMDAMNEEWVRFYVSDVYQTILSSLNSTEKQNLASNISILTTYPTFNFMDQRPASTPASLGPSELGLVYALLFSFHQFNFSLEIYSFMRKRIKYRSYLFYRFLASQINALVLALVYALVTIAFQVPTNVTFGHSGFVVLWMFIFLYMSSMGTINENVVSVLFAFDKKTLIAPWMIFMIVTNISVTFAPFVLSPGFYKYGYASPMYNTYEALKVVFYNTWKGHLGRNLGILVCWIVVGNISLIFVSNWATNKAKRLAKKQKTG